MRITKLFQSPLINWRSLFICIHLSLISTFFAEESPEESFVIMRKLFGPSLRDFYAFKEKDPEKAKEVLIKLLNGQPDSLLLNKEMGYLLIREKKYEESLIYFQHVEKLDPEDIQNQLQIGYLLDLLNRKEEAIKKFEKIASSSKDNDSREKAALALKNLRDTSSSNQVSKEENLELEKYYSLKTKDPKEAYKHLKRQLNENPTSFDLNKEMGYFLLSQKKLNESIDYFKIAQELDPSDDTISLQLGYLYDLIGRKQASKRQFYKAAHSPDPDIRQKARLALRTTQQSPQPVEDQKTEQLNKYYTLKKVNLQEAKQLLTEILKQNPDELDLNKEMGYLLLQMKDLAGSLPFFLHAEELDPYDKGLSLQLGFIFDDLDRKSEALEQFQRALKSEDPDVHYKASVAIHNLEQQKETIFSSMLDRYYQLKKENPRAAESLLHELITAYPNNLTLNKEMGYLLLNKEQLEKSIPFFKKASEIDPSDGSLFLQLGYIFDKLNDKHSAIEEFKKASLSQDKKVQKQALAALENLSPPAKAPNALSLDDFYRVKKTNPKEAEIILHQLLRDHPHSITMNKEMGFLLLNQNELEKSLKYFRQVEELDPKDGQNILQIGFILDKLGKKEEAIAQFKKGAQFSDPDIKQKSVVALKNLMGEGEGKQAKAKETSLDDFYKLKDKDPIAAYHLLLEIINKNPKSAAAHAEMGLLQIKFKNKCLALYYYQKAHELEPCNLDYGIQTATLLYQLGNQRDASHLMDKTVCMHKGSDRNKACLARVNLASQYCHLVEEPYFVELGYSPVYFNRFHDYVTYSTLRAGVALGKNNTTEIYYKSTLTQDTRSNTAVALPQIYNDNVWIHAIGLRFIPFNEFRYLGYYLEGGEAYDLQSRNRNRWRSDFRTGLYFYREWFPEPHCPDRLIFPFSHYRELYGDSSYYSRYRNVIGYARWREGFMIAEWKTTSLRAYGKVFYGFDTRKEFFNNFIEIGPGVSIYPTNLLNLAFRFEWISGYYVPVNGPDVNPYGPRYYDQRYEIDYYVRF